MLSKIPRKSRFTSKIISKKHALKLSPQRRHFSFDPTTLSLAVGVPSLLTLGLVAFAVHRYKTSGPKDMLVRTGLGISDILVTKKGYHWPFQKFRFINLRPTNFDFELNSMSSEKLEFVLPGSFTIGPKDDTKSLVLYAKLMGDDMENK